MSLYKTVGRNDPSYLLADPQGVDVIAIPCEPGHGIINRGTIMYRKSTGMYAPAQSDNAVSTNNLVVLDEVVDTDASLTVAEDANAYRAGRLVAGKVTLANDTPITDAIAVALRVQGIMLDQMEGSVFNNERISITYDANGGTGDAHVIYESKGATHTVIAGTAAGFTAPSGKSFSKWNTATDGSGTDYSASASYVANASLTLYAIWA